MHISHSSVTFLWKPLKKVAMFCSLFWLNTNVSETFKFINKVYPYKSKEQSLSGEIGLQKPKEYPPQSKEHHAIPSAQILVVQEKPSSLVAFLQSCKFMIRSGPAEAKQKTTWDDPTRPPHTPGSHVGLSSPTRSTWHKQRTPWNIHC